MGHGSNDKRAKPEKFTPVEKILDMRVYDLANEKDYRSLDDYFREKEAEHQHALELHPNRNRGVQYLHKSEDPAITEFDRQEHKRKSAAHRRQFRGVPWPRKRMLDFVRQGLTICEKSPHNTPWTEDKPSIVIEENPEGQNGEWITVMSKADARKKYNDHLENLEQEIADKQAVLQDVAVYDAGKIAVHEDLESFLDEKQAVVEDMRLKEKRDLYTAIADEVGKVKSAEENAALIVVPTPSLLGFGLKAVPADQAEKEYKKQVIQNNRRLQRQLVA